MILQTLIPLQIWFSSQNELSCMCTDFKTEKNGHCQFILNYFNLSRYGEIMWYQCQIAVVTFIFLCMNSLGFLQKLYREHEKIVDFKTTYLIIVLHIAWTSLYVLAFAIWVKLAKRNLWKWVICTYYWMISQSLGC